MSIAERIGTVSSHIESTSRATEFYAVCRLLMLAKGQRGAAARLAEEQRAAPNVQAVLKAAVTAGGFGGGTSWGSQLADFKLQVAAFASGLSAYGCFDALLPFMVRAPLSSTVGAVSTIATAYVVGELSAKAISRLSLTNGTLEPAKAHCVVVVAAELLKYGGAGTLQLLQREITNACVRAIDTSFIADVLLSGVSIGTSSGNTAEAARADIAGMLALVPTDATSRLFLLVTPAVLKSWSMMGAATTQNAAPAFPGLSATQGGEISGIRVIATDGLPATANVVLVDAGGVAAATGDVVLDVLSEGSIMMNDAPDSPPSASTVHQSLWELNLSALRIERFWGGEKVRTGAVAAILNAGSYQGGMSPP